MIYGRQVAIAVAMFVATATSSQAVGDIRDATLSCVSALITVHQVGGLSFQEQKEIGTFYVEISHATESARAICETEKNSNGFQRAFCQAPIVARVGGDTLYGEDDKTFRGYFPWTYFVIFDDGHFLWSSSTSDGVMLRTGICSAKGQP